MPKKMKAGVMTRSMTEIAKQKAKEKAERQEEVSIKLCFSTYAARAFTDPEWKDFDIEKMGEHLASKMSA